MMLRLIETRMQDATISLVTQVLRAGGRIVFGGHPAITPMVAQAAIAWKPRADVAAPIVIYQSEYFANLQPPPGRDEMIAAGLARMVKTEPGLDRVVQELGLPQKSAIEWLPEQAPEKAGRECAEALLCMRLRMLKETLPVGVVCLGGMEGIEAEARLYRRLLRGPEDGATARLFVFRSTFGASARLDEEGAEAFETSYQEAHGEEDRQLHGLSERGVLQPSAEMAAQQLENPIRYDRMMEVLVRKMADRPPVQWRFGG